MIDTHDIRRDPRRLAAMETDSGSSRGWDFRPSDEPHIAFRAVAEVFRPRSLIILAVLAGTIALWWL
jgi:hypothetical protein